MHILSDEEAMKGRGPNTVAAYDPRFRKDLSVVQFSKALRNGWRVYGFLGGRQRMTADLPWRLIVGATRINDRTWSPSRVRVLVVPPTSPHDNEYFRKNFRRHEIMWKGKNSVRVTREGHNPFRDGMDAAPESTLGGLLLDGVFFWNKESINKYAVIGRYVLCKTGNHRSWKHTAWGYRNTNHLKDTYREHSAGRKGRTRYYIEKPRPGVNVLVGFESRDGFAWNGWAWQKEVEIV